MGRRFILKTLIGKILSETGAVTSRVILNVGAGGGDTSVMLQAFGTVRSVELDQALYSYCRDIRKLEVDLASVLSLPYEENSFDMVCLFDVLEHVEEDNAALKELRRVVKPGGYIFMTAPAYQFLWSGHDVVNQHKRRYTRKELNEKAAAAGFTPFYSSYFNSLLFLPVAAMRGIKNLFKRKDPLGDFSTPAGPLNKFLIALFKSEISLLYPRRLPFGVSVFAVYRKPF